MSSPFATNVVGAWLEDSPSANNYSVSCWSKIQVRVRELNPLLSLHKAEG